MSSLEKIRIIYKDKDIVALNKPAGLIVHPTNLKDQRKTLVDWLLKNYPEVKKVGDNPRLRPGIVHRLDKGTSGILLVARNQKAFNFLKQKFQERKIKKEYLVLVSGVVKKKQGLIDKKISRARGKKFRWTTFQKNEKKARSALTEYEVFKKFKDFTLLKVYPKTGRTHQIRVHLSAISHPVAGDKTYGQFKKRPKIPELSRPFLHAWILELSLNGKRLRIQADLPAELKKVLKSLD